MVSSAGICNLSQFDRVGNGEYSSQIACESLGETTLDTMTFKVNDTSRIVEIDGQPYHFLQAVELALDPWSSALNGNLRSGRG